MEPRALASRLAAGRVAVGAAMLAAPGLSARVWLGPRGRGAATTIALRAFGAREVAIGLGALLAMRRDAPVRGWVEAGALGDAVDAALMLAAGDDVPPLGRWAVATAAAGGAALGAAVAPRLEQASDFERAGGASFNATV